MIYRRAEPGDAGRVADLGAYCFTEKFGDLYRTEDLSGFLAGAHSEAKVATEIADPAMRIMLAEKGDELLGYCKLVMRGGWPEHARGSRPIELKQLYTHPKAIGQGIGSHLVRWADDEARASGADEIQLSVYAENLDAQRFYARHGYGRIADIYFMVGTQRDEEFLFAKLLDPV